MRNETKLADVFGAQMLEAPAPSQPGQGLLDFVAGVDVTDPATLGPELFQDADHVRRRVLCVLDGVDYAFSS